MQADLFGAVQCFDHLPDLSLQWYRGWLDAELSASLFARLRSGLHWQQSTILVAGCARKIPRLNAWYGDSGCSYRYSGSYFEPLPWPPELQSLRVEIEQVVGCSFNSCLANLYRDGRDSVAWHSDDELELAPEPVIASLSLGASRRFSLKHKQGACERVDLELAAGDLLVMSGQTQSMWLHSIPKQVAVDGARINLTYRRVLLPHLA